MRTMRDDLREFSGEQLLWLAVMSNETTRVLIHAELNRRAGARRRSATRKPIPSGRVRLGARARAVA